MALVCLKCEVVYGNRKIVYDPKIFWNDCPKSDCGGNVVEIDEHMIQVILILNKKYYFSEYCCGGHFYDNSANTYIKFHPEIDLPSVPKGFRSEAEGNVIRKKYKYDNDTELYLQIIQTSKDLIRWATSLPENPRKADLMDLYEELF